MSFKTDLQAGQEIEKKFADILKQRNPLSTVTIIEWYHPWWDVEMKWPDWIAKTFEIKFDRMVDITGNIALEVSFKWNPSGICNSKAHYIIYYAKDTFWYAVPSEVRDKVIEYERIYGWDNNTSELVLIRRQDFITIFKRRC